MSSRKVWLLAIVLLGWSPAAHGEKKVTLCHVAPGNPAKLQTISVGEAAVSAHLAHGDQVGACTAACPSSCDDGDLCTSDSCGADGQCTHSAVSCDDGMVCTRDECDPDVGCLRLANPGAACDDGNDCTGSDACESTECRGTAIAGCCAGDLDCDDGAPCTDDACFLGECENTQRSCAVDNKCLAGFCDASGDCDTVEVGCDDANVCTDDGCDPVFGCTHVATVSPPESPEVSCTDSSDNDCDGAIDRADSDCDRCGDGVLQPPEQCDDGNTNPFDGCDDCFIVDITPD